jgi:hypothetical protein
MKSPFAMLTIILVAAIAIWAPSALAQKVSGQGALKFKVLYTSDHLPDEAQATLIKAHGGFAIDRRPGKGDIYFWVPGAGIVHISGDLKTTRMIETPAEIRDFNMHNTSIWYGVGGEARLVFPGNNVAQVFTTSLSGKLLNTLTTPTADDDFDEPIVNAYFKSGGKFAPTDVDYLGGLYFISTGYSDLDYVLTARVEDSGSVSTSWADLAFGGRGEGVGQLGTGHGITVSPDQKRITVADRKNAEIECYTRFGHYRETVSLPKGSLTCDIDYAAGYSIIGCLRGPDTEKGAPIYILKNDKLVSTIMPKEELGLAGFQHVHNAVLAEGNGKLYIIAQSWNPGDFAILEQTGE